MEALKQIAPISPTKLQRTESCAEDEFLLESEEYVFKTQTHITKPKELSTSQNRFNWQTLCILFLLFICSYLMYHIIGSSSDTTPFILAGDDKKQKLYGRFALHFYANPRMWYHSDGTPNYVWYSARIWTMYCQLYGIPLLFDMKPCGQIPPVKNPSVYGKIYRRCHQLQHLRSGKLKTDFLITLDADTFPPTGPSIESEQTFDFLIQKHMDPSKHILFFHDSVSGRCSGLKINKPMIVKFRNMTGSCPPILMLMIVRRSDLGIEFVRKFYRAFMNGACPFSERFEHPYEQNVLWHCMDWEYWMPHVVIANESSHHNRFFVHGQKRREKYKQRASRMAESWVYSLYNLSYVEAHKGDNKLGWKMR